MELLGILLQLAYRLRTHLWLGWSLARWLGVLLVIAATALALRGSAQPWAIGSLGALFLAYELFLAWAARRRWVLFQSVPQGAHAGLPAARPLRAEELVPVQASGRFTVEGQERYFMDLDADFETVGSREHIILARVHPSRFLLLGQRPGEELGWWYIFFQPGMICQLVAGTLYFGARPRPALSVTYSPDGETHETVYMTFADAAAHRRVWHDLTRDAPPAPAASPRHRRVRGHT